MALILVFIDGVVSILSDPGKASGLVEEINSGRRVVDLPASVGPCYAEKGMGETVIVQAGSYGPGPSFVPSLSDEERVILRLMGDGLTRKQIAGNLGISFRSVDVRRELLRAKLGASCNAQLVGIAVSYGLIKPVIMG
jgi:DNA-binding NarL/FixJ family response regulator